MALIIFIVKVSGHKKRGKYLILVSTVSFINESEKNDCFHLILIYFLQNMPHLCFSTVIYKYQTYHYIILHDDAV